jgi:hypothetical protein
VRRCGGDFGGGMLGGGGVCCCRERVRVVGLV